MKLNLISPTHEELKRLEDHLFATDPIFMDLASIRHIDDGDRFPDIDLDTEAKGFMAKNRMEIFSHHTYDLIKKKDEEIERLKAELHQQRFNNEHNLSIDQTVADQIKELKGKIFDLELQAHASQPNSYRIMLKALEKIEDPRKMDHEERDLQTKIYCLMNVAHVALEKIRGI